MQYVSRNSVTVPELREAIAAMSKDLDNESRSLDNFDSIIKKNGVDTDALPLLNYGSALEEVLLESPELCGLATSMLYTMSSRQLGNSIAIGLPILAASLLAAPVVVALGASVAVGTAVGVGTGSTVAAKPS